MAEVQGGYHQDARIQSYIMILLLAQIAAMLYSTKTSCHYGYNTIIQPDNTNPGDSAIIFEVRKKRFHFMSMHYDTI